MRAHVCALTQAEWTHRNSQRSPRQRPSLALICSEVIDLPNRQ